MTATVVLRRGRRQRPRRGVGRAGRAAHPSFLRPGRRGVGAPPRHGKAMNAIMKFFRKDPCVEHYQLGRVLGFSFDIETGELTTLVVGAVGVPLLGEGILSTWELPVDEIVSSGPDRIIVYEGAEEKLKQLNTGLLEKLGIGGGSLEREERERYRLNMVPVENQLPAGVPTEQEQRRLEAARQERFEPQRQEDEYEYEDEDEEVDDEDDQEDEEKEEDEDENETTTTTTKDRGPSQLPLLKTSSPSRDDIRHKDKDGDDDKEEEHDITISSGGSSRLASSPRSVRFVKIRNDAATVVQKHWKGSNDRKAFLKQKHAATTIQSSFRGNKARRGAVREMKEKVKRQEKETKAAIKIQSKFRGSKARITVTELRKEIRRKEEERLVLDAKRERERAERKSAILIQKSFRGMQQRKFYGEIKAEKARHHAATRIQSLYRGVKTRAQVANECKAQAAFAALEKREAENEKKKRACILLQAQVRSFFARREAQKLREFAKLKIEAKLYARKRVEERIEAKMNELRMKSARICA